MKIVLGKLGCAARRGRGRWESRFGVAEMNIRAAAI
jgi:hypothetical protein